MMSFEDIRLQLVDLPPLSSEHPRAWIAGTLQSADAALLIVDLSDPDVVRQIEEVRAELAARRIALEPVWPAERADSPAASDADDPFALRLPVLLLANKADLDPDSARDVEALEDLLGVDYPALAVSAQTGAGLAALGPWLFRHLDIVRVYTKAPGKPPDRARPFTLARGQTVADVARLVHRELADSIRYARLWNAGHDGQQIGRDHPVSDGDVIELHT